MTDPLHRSLSSDKGAKGVSQDHSQDIAETPDPATAKAADCPDRQPNLVLDIQTLQILDSSDDCIKMLDLEGRILFMNRGGQVLLGIQDITPLLNTSWVNFWQEGERQTAMNAIAQAAAGKACSLQGYCPTLKGEPKWWDNKISPILGGDGNVERLLCISRDITDRQQAEEIIRRNGDRDAFLITLNDALRPLTDAIAIEATANRVLGEYLAVSRVTYFEVRGADYFVEQDYVNGAASLQGCYPIESFGATLLATYRSGRTATSTDVATDPQLSPEQRSAYADIQIAAYIGVPLVKQGEFVAGLAVHSAYPRNWTSEEIALVEEVAERTWAAVERARVEAARQQSEEKYRSLFESIDQGFCLFELLFDANGKPIDYRFVDVNRAFEQQCGLADAVGKTILELAPNFEPQWIDLYAQVAKSGEAIRFEADVPSLNGVFDVYAFPSGAPGQHRVAALFANITERKQTEAAIAADLRDTQLLHDLSARLATEENIQALYQEIMAAAIALTHADAGTVQILDETTQDLLLLATQGLDRTMTDHFYRVNASSYTPCGVALRSNIRSFVDFDLPASEDSDGSMRLHVEAGLLSAQSTPLISRSGKPIGMVSTHWRTRHRPSERELRFLDLLARQAADLIEQRQAEAQRKQLLEQEQTAREEAERVNRIKDEFLAVLSHELRSPLNPILGWSRLLQNSKLDAVRQREALATIERNAKLQTQLIEDLLDISRIMRGKLSLTVAPVSLSYVISAAVETVRLAAEAKKIQLILDLAPEIALVSGDAARLQQVIWNLLTNAVKFTPSGGRIEVQLSLVNSHSSFAENEQPMTNDQGQITHYAEIRVTDTGKGINPPFLPYVFEYFRQEDGSTTRKFGGLGLGLAIVRQIVQMHGGEVWAESQGEGQGATFIVQLPAMQQRAVVSEPSQPHSDVELLPLAGIQILLVDDEPDTREFQAFLLEQSGAKVAAVVSGLEALQALEQSTPDVLISDIGMAEMDGYTLMQQMRSRLPNQAKPFPAIALTAYARDLDQQQAIAAGFQRHLTKPIEPEQLISAIVHLLKESRAS